MNKRLVVIAGPANSGKFPLAKKLLSEDPDLFLIHRDPLREMLGNKIDEGHITIIMSAIARSLLRLHHSALACAWNLEPLDKWIWTRLSEIENAPLIWLDTREPRVQAMIPPMEASDAS